MHTHLRAFALSLCFSLAACAGPSALAPAKSGDLVALKSALSQDLQTGRLTRSALVRIATVLASHEIESAKGADALSRIAQSRMCARRLISSLETRAEQMDDAGAEAAMALLLANAGDADAWRKHAGSENSSWRAVGARTLFRSSDGDRRRQLLSDNDEKVRLAAVRSSELAFDKSDVPLLMDAAKHDPNDLIRGAALRAVAATLPSEVLVVELKDLWARASQGLRSTIVAVWSFPGMLEAGGQRELLTVAETTDGSPAIIAGGILYRLGAETKGSGLAALVRGAKTGVASNRVLAISMSSVDEPAMLAAIVEQAKSPEPSVKVAALSKLVKCPAHRDNATKELGALSVSKVAGSDLARAAMARTGDLRVTSLLIEDGKSDRPETRATAMSGFADLEDWGRVGLFLADADVRVRMRTACQILNASERW